MSFENIDLHSVLSEIYRNIDEENHKEVEKQTKLFVEKYIAEIGVHNEVHDLKRDKALNRFWSYVFLQVGREVRPEMEAPMAVTMKNNQLVLLINPYAFNRDWTVENITEIILHEGYHLIMKHLSMFNFAFENPTTQLAMNIATDCEINQRLPYLPEGCVTLDTVKELTGLKSVEPLAGSMYYFELLMKHAEDKLDQMSQQNQQDQGQGQGDGQDQNQDSQSQGQGQNQNQDQGQGSQGQNRDWKEVDNRNNFGKNGKNPLQNPSRHNSWQENEGNFLGKDEVTQKVFEQATRQYERYDKNAGNLPGDIVELIKKLNEKPQVKWTSHIVTSIGRQLRDKKRSINRLNRRSPYMIHKKGVVNDHIKPIVCAFDTSGSVSDIELAYYFNEISHIANKMSVPITLIMFDYDISHVQTLNKVKESDVRAYGRGGTRFQALFDYLRDNKYDKQTQLFVFTDGGGESRIETHGYDQYKWFLSSDWGLSVQDNTKPVIPIQTPAMNR